MVFDQVGVIIVEILKTTIYHPLFRPTDFPVFPHLFCALKAETPLLELHATDGALGQAIKEQIYDGFWFAHHISTADNQLRYQN